MALQNIPFLDLMMDLSMLMVTQLAFGAFQPRRLIAAALLMSGCTALVEHLDLSPIFALLMHPAVLILSAGCITGARRPGRILEACMCMLCVGAAGAGFMMLGRRMMLFSALAGCGMLLFLLRRRRHENYRWNIEIYVEKDGLGASFPALIDTGNRLTEHRAFLPVLIVEASAMGEIPNHIAGLSPEQLQFLPFGVLGSSGELCSFRPDKVEIILPGQRSRAAPPCWVAVYPGHIPGSVRALAPPAFTQALKSRPSESQPEIK